MPRNLSRKPQSAAKQSPSPAPPPSKIGRVLDLLRQPDGVTIAELAEATGWQPHTTRAALTGLRKKGHAIERYKRDGVSAYRISTSE